MRKCRDIWEEECLKIASIRVCFKQGDSFISCIDAIGKQETS